jgi:hypothetical protein
MRILKSSFFGCGPVTAGVRRHTFEETLNVKSHALAIFLLSVASTVVCSEVTLGQSLLLPMCWFSGKWKSAAGTERKVATSCR